MNIDDSTSTNISCIIKILFKCIHDDRGRESLEKFVSG